MEVSEGREGFAMPALRSLRSRRSRWPRHGRTFLVPLAISILVWNLLEAMIERFASVRLGSFQVPNGSRPSWASPSSARPLSRRLNSSQPGRRCDRGVAALCGAVADDLGDLTQWLGAEQSAKLREAFGKIDLTERLPAAFASAQSFVVTLLLILAYVGFLFVESAT